MSLEEELGLDVAPGLAAIDELEARISALAETIRADLGGAITDALSVGPDAMAGLSDAISEGLRNASASGVEALRSELEAASPSIDAEVNVAGAGLAIDADALQDSLDSLTVPDLTVDVTADTSGLSDAAAVVDGLVSEVEGRDAVLGVEADTSGVDTAGLVVGQVADDVEGLAPSLTIGADASAVEEAGAIAAGVVADIDASGASLTIGADTEAVEAAGATVSDLAATVDATDPLLSIGVDASQVEAATSAVEGLVAGVAGLAPEVSVGADISGVEDAQAAVADLVTSADGASAEVTITADVGEVTAAVASVEDLVAGVEEASAEVVIAADASAVEDATAAVESLVSAADEGLSVDVTADTAAVTDAVSDTEALGSAVDAVDGSTVTIGADTSGVADAVAALDELANAGEAANQTVTIGVDASGLSDAADQAKGAAAALPEVGRGAEAAQGGISGLEALALTTTGGLGGLRQSALRLSPSFAGAVAGTAALTAGIGALFDIGLKSSTSAERFRRVLGDQADAVNNLKGAVPGLNQTLGELSIATGSSAGSLRQVGATFFTTATSAGISRDQAALLTSQYLALANAVAAGNASLGPAQGFIAQLGRSLATGGRFAAQFGLGFLSAGAIAERASEQFGKPRDQLTLVEKQAAGLAIVMEHLGPTMAASIAQGTEAPAIKLRSLEAQLTATLAAAGRPLVQPLTDAMVALAPVVESTAGVFGALAGGAIPAFTAAIRPVLITVDALASVLEAIPTPLLAAAGGAIVGAKGFAILFDATQNVARGLSRLVASFGEVGLAERLRGIVTTSEATASQLRNVASASQTLATAQAGLRASLTATAATSEASAAALAALDAEKAASVAVSQAYVRVQAAEAAAVEAAGAARTGGAAEVAAYAAAEAEAVAATTAYTAAQQRLASATATSASAVAAAAATTEGAQAGVAAAATEVTLASEGMTAATATATGSTLTLSSVLGPLALVAGLALGAVLLFSSGAEESGEAMKKATEAGNAYVDSLKLTNGQLANLSTADATRQFESLGETQRKFLDAVNEAGKGAVFNQLGFNAATATAAIAGNSEALAQFRGQLFDTKQAFAGVQDALQISSRPELIAELREEFVRTGFVTDEFANKLRSAGIEIFAFKDAGLSPITRTFEKQRAEAEQTTTAFINLAKSEIASGSTSEIAGVQYLASTGKLGALGAEGEAAARALLRKADAEQQASERSIEAAATTSQLTGEQRALAESALAAADALTSVGSVDLSGLTAARDLRADSEAWAELTKEQQDAVDAVIAYGDEAIKTAQDNDQLIASTGELGANLASLTEHMNTAADRFEELSTSGLQGNDDGLGFVTQEKAARAARGAIRDVTDAVREYGTDLDFAGAKTGDAADRADELFNSLDASARALRENAETQVRLGGDAEVAKNVLKLQAAQFEQTALKAGISSEQVQKLLEAEGLLPSQIDTNFKASGIDEINEQLRKLNLTILLLQGAISPSQFQPIADALRIPDAEQQAAALNQALAGLDPKIRSIVEFVLDAPSYDAAKAAGEDLAKPETKLISLGFEADAIARVNAEVADFQARHPEIKVAVSADTHAAVAELDRISQSRVTHLLAKGESKEAARELDNVAAERTALIKTRTDPGSATEADRRLAFLAADRIARFQAVANTEGVDAALQAAATDRSARIVVDADTGLARHSIFGLLGALPRGTVPIDADLSPLLRAVRGVGAIVAAAPKVRVPLFGNAAGGVIAGGVQVFAEGGIRGGDKITEALRRRRLENRSAEPGFFGPGSYAAVFAEDSTAGEFFISRDPTKRARNEAILQAAATDFGFTLAAPTALAAPAALARPTVTEPVIPERLISTLSTLAAAIDAQEPVVVNAGSTIDQVIVEQPPEDIGALLDSVAALVRR